MYTKKKNQEEMPAQFSVAFLGVHAALVSLGNTFTTISIAFTEEPGLI